MPSCMEYQLQNITSRIFLHHSPYIIGYLLPTYIRCRVTYHLPHTQFLKNCISMTLLTVGPQCMHAICKICWQLTRMRVHCREKKKHVISRYRTCDLLTWSQQLFCHGYMNILTCNLRAKSDGYKQVYIHTYKQAYEQKFLHLTP